MGDPPPLALATPRLRQEAFGMYVHAAARFKGKDQCNSPRRKSMNTTAAAVNKSTANTNKQQTAKEVIAANVQALIEQLEQGHSEALTAYLTAMGRFHTYSFGNILEIARQRAVTYCFTSLESIMIRACAS
jgi:uncharacterized MAPEG superfamily protein